MRRRLWLVPIGLWLTGAAMVLIACGSADSLRFGLLPFIVTGPLVGWLWCASTERRKMRADFDAADRYARALAQTRTTREHRGLN